MSKEKKEKLKTVVTVSGKTVDIKNACLIDKEYYEKHVDCVPILENNIEKWYATFNPKIAYDFVSEKWVLSSEFEKNLSPNLRKFLIGFHQDDLKKRIYGWDNRNNLLNVSVKSHYNDDSKNLKTYEKEIEKYKKSLLEKQDRLEEESIFRNFYGRFISFLSKLRYYVQVMEKSYDIDACQQKDFVKIINEVDNFINFSSEVHDTFVDFDYCYKLYVDTNQPKVENSTLEKLSYEVLQKNEHLKKVFKLFIDSIGVIKSIEKEIQQCELYIRDYQKAIDDIAKKGCFSAKCRTKEEAVELGFTDSNKSDDMYFKNNLTKDQLKDLKESFPVFSEGVYRNIKINYNASAEASTFNKILTEYHLLEPTRKINKDSYKLAKLLKGLSFGIEFETSCGRLREQDLSILGIIPLRDGSIKGFEYTTIPYGMKDSSLKETGFRALGKDLNTLKKVCEELQNKTKINNSCSMHLHIGGARKDKLYLIALYMLAYQLQDEMFLMQPKFKEDAIKYLGLQKNYCQKLNHLDLFKNCIFDKSSILKSNYCDNVDLHFNNIFKFLSGGYDIGSKFNRKNHIHPYQRKWERMARYHWVNLVNCVFSDSGTIEFRLHASTLNFTKVLNWILICSAIVKYAETHTKEIVSGSLGKIDLNTILLGYSNNFRDKKTVNSYGLFIYNYLTAYVKERKNYFKEQFQKGEIDGSDDLKKDSSYSFDFNGIDSLISN